MLPRFSKSCRGFTLVEMSIAAACVVIAGGTAFVLLQSATTLFLSGHAANRSNQLAYLTMDRLTRDVHSSIEIPALVDGTGTALTLTGSAPVSAAGIKFRVYSGGPYRIPAATAATATAIGLALQPGDAMPGAGQLLAIPAVSVNGIRQDVYARVASVSPAPPATSTTPTVTLTGTLGSFTNPTAASGTLVPADSAAHVVNDIAYIVVTPPLPATPELRFYPRAMSVAVDGATAFNNSSNYVVITVDMTASPLPFSMAIGDRAVSVTLSVQDTTNSNRVKSAFMKNFSIGSPSVPVRIYNRSLGL
jgi:type II secretory pathway pseudopilin PulG